MGSRRKPGRRPNGAGSFGYDKARGFWYGRRSYAVDGKLIKQTVYGKTKEEMIAKFECLPPPNTTNRRRPSPSLDALKIKVDGEPPRGIVYFVQSPSTGRIKIGFSRSPKSRISVLSRAAGDILRFIAVVHATMLVEKHLHRTFRQHRAIGEWFEPAPEILEYISGLPPMPKHYAEYSIQSKTIVH